MTARASDWRSNYVICEHVAADEANGTRHRGFRVCCEACYKNGSAESFLHVEPLAIEERDGFSVGTVRS